jgi:hypothetical protein
VLSVWREAKFSAVFGFEVDETGKPIRIESFKNPLFLKDDAPFIACISSWSLPTASGKGTATFVWEWACKSIEISVNGGHKSFPCQQPKPTSQSDPHQP